MTIAVDWYITQQIKQTSEELDKDFTPFMQ